MYLILHLLYSSLSFSTGHEEDDYRMLTSTEEGGSLELNNPGLYSTVCVELMVDMLAVNAVLQASHINDYEGASGTSVSFDYAPQVSILTCAQECTDVFEGYTDVLYRSILICCEIHFEIIVRT